MVSGKTALGPRQISRQVLQELRGQRCAQERAQEARETLDSLTESHPDLDCVSQVARKLHYKFYTSADSRAKLYTAALRGIAQSQPGAPLTALAAIEEQLGSWFTGTELEGARALVDSYRNSGEELQEKVKFEYGDPHPSLMKRWRTDLDGCPERYQQMLRLFDHGCTAGDILGLTPFRMQERMDHLEDLAETATRNLSVEHPGNLANRVDRNLRKHGSTEDLKALIRGWSRLQSDYKKVSHWRPRDQASELFQAVTDFQARFQPEQRAFARELVQHSGSFDGVEKSLEFLDARPGDASDKIAAFAQILSTLPSKHHPSTEEIYELLESEEGPPSLESRELFCGLVKDLDENGFANSDRGLQLYRFTQEQLKGDPDRVAEFRPLLRATGSVQVSTELQLILDREQGVPKEQRQQLLQDIVASLESHSKDKPYKLALELLKLVEEAPDPTEWESRATDLKGLVEDSPYRPVEKFTEHCWANYNHRFPGLKQLQQNGEISDYMVAHYCKLVDRPIQHTEATERESLLLGLLKDENADASEDYRTASRYHAPGHFGSAVRWLQRLTPVLPDEKDRSRFFFDLSLKPVELQGAAVQAYLDLAGVHELLGNEPEAIKQDFEQLLEQASDHRELSHLVSERLFALKYAEIEDVLPQAPGVGPEVNFTEQQVLVGDFALARES